MRNKANWNKPLNFSFTADVEKPIKNRLNKAMLRAMGRSGQRAFRQLQDMLSKRYNIAYSDLNDGKLITKSYNQYRYIIRVKKVGLSAVLFKPVQTSGTKSTRVTGVGGKRKTKSRSFKKERETSMTVEFIRKRREDIKKPFGNNPFIGKMPKRGLGVYYRQGKARNKLTRYTIGSLGGMMATDFTVNELRSKFIVDYKAELKRQLEKAEFY